TEPLPRATAALAAAMQPRAQQAMDRPLKALERAPSVGHPTVVAVPMPFPPDRLPEGRECPCVALLTEPALALHQRATASLLRIFPLPPCLPRPALSPGRGQAEKAQGWQRSACPECLPGVAFTTCEQTGLLGVEPSPALSQPQREDPYKPLGVVLTLT